MRHRPAPLKSVAAIALGIAVLVAVCAALAGGCASAPKVRDVTAQRQGFTASETALNLGAAVGALDLKARQQLDPGIKTARVVLDIEEGGARAAINVPPTPEQLQDVAALDNAKTAQAVQDKLWDESLIGKTLRIAATRTAE